LTFHPLTRGGGERANKPAGGKTGFWRIIPVSVQAGYSARASGGNRFSAGLQLFVPFAQKDARLAWRANQGATCFSVS
jgi:hypothetical protein